MRSLPYYGDKAPLILFRDEDDGMVCDIQAEQGPVDDRLAKLYENGIGKDGSNG